LSTIAERVARGAALLDEREPGWWQRIDLSKLDLASTCRCVLGQLNTDRDGPYPRWSDILDRFGVQLRNEFSHGFNVGGEGTEAKFANLTAAWRELIEERRGDEPR
jgi:hypothetical protein